MWALLSVGLMSGLYHGIYNNAIYHKNGQFNNYHERIHTLWIHFVSGLAGSFCLYLLYSKFFAGLSADFEIADIFIFTIGFLGLVGLLPMTLWFLVLDIAKVRELLERMRKVT